MPNVSQLSLICAWNSFAINTVKLKQHSTKRKTKNGTKHSSALYSFFSKPKVTKIFASYHKFGKVHIFKKAVMDMLLV